ncbi:hypothetical protein Aam_093_009 [Acidocella aminolytica 101 = DSM 11237]|uniref:Uncharacterized protein n=1 Tax=Acidocella aminolytica 101 = DSM 11237 TaxID=1120923 RepID=A0A0D6PKZ7_9PROT|nr:hypothetical protein Aam_093_009 [Acidocella aminolytica 101 = DSM 11237]GBQ32420.1 hypothetical protein AA11237_0153 [Acidocella aminolytica 101 = DSM 11237]
MAKAVVVVDILVLSKPAKHRLAKLCRQGVAVVLAGSAAGQQLPSHLCEAKGIVQFLEGK